MREETFIYVPEIFTTLHLCANCGRGTLSPKHADALLALALQRAFAFLPPSWQKSCHLRAAWRDYPPAAQGYTTDQQNKRYNSSNLSPSPSPSLSLLHFGNHVATNSTRGYQLSWAPGSQSGNYLEVSVELSDLIGSIVLCLVWTYRLDFWSSIPGTCIWAPVHVGKAGH